jgi:hypothetical protein
MQTSRVCVREPGGSPAAALKGRPTGRVTGGFVFLIGGSVLDLDEMHGTMFGETWS